MTSLRLGDIAPDFSAQTSEVAAPANWKSGEDCVILPSVSSKQARSESPKGFTEIKPYLRMTPQPDI